MYESTLSGVLDIVFLMGTFVGILGMAYYFTKKIALLKKGSAYTRNMHIIEVLPLAVGQMLYIIKVGNEYHLMATTKENIQHCGKIDAENLVLEKLKEENFKDYLSKYTKSKQEKSDEGSKI